MEYAPTRFKDHVMVGLICLGIVACLPVLAILAFALRPAVLVGVTLAVAGGWLLCAVSPRFRHWLDARSRREPRYRGLRLAPEEVALHPSHSWALLHGVVVVGADDLAQAALGPVDSVELPSVGRHVNRGDGLFRLRHAGRTLDVRAPVSGTVIARNRALRRHPELINRKPFSQGWAVRLRGDDLDEDQRHLLRGRRARTWFRHDVDRLLRSVPAAPADEDAAADRLHLGIDDDAWSRLSTSLFAGRPESKGEPAGA